MPRGATPAQRPPIDPPTIVTAKLGENWFGISAVYLKDPRFGMGMGSIYVSEPERRDRLWLRARRNLVLNTYSSD